MHFVRIAVPGSIAILAATFAADAVGAATAPPPQAHVAVHRLPMSKPVGAVLYDQSSTSDNHGARIEATAAGSAGTAAEGADDFVVGSGGWNVTGLAFSAFGADASGAIGAPPAHIDVSIHDDAGGVPSASARCSYRSLATRYEGSPWYRLSVGLPDACALPQGHYWITAAFVRGAQDSFSGYWGQTGELHNAPALVRTTGSAGACEAWTPLSGCGLAASGSRDFGFQILGTAGAAADECGADGLCLKVTVAEDNGDPAQCGTATSVALLRGHKVNYCYIATNRSSTTLNYHFLSDTVSGRLLHFKQRALAPGESYQYNRTLIASDAVQPTATWTATSAAPDYTAAVSGDSFIDITAAGTPLYLGGDGTALVQMPFPFDLFVTTSRALCISTDGLMVFDASSDQDCSVAGSDNTPFQYFTAPDGHQLPSIEPFWDDLNFHGNVYYATLGQAPQRQFVVEWRDRDHVGETRGAGYVTFEAVLEEADGSLSFRYRKVTFDDAAHADWDYGGSATVSLQTDSTDFMGNLYSYNARSLANDSTLTWTRTPVTTYSATAQTQVRPQLPLAQVAPAAIDAAAAAGATTTANLAIGNHGDYMLDWQLGADHGGSRAHFPPVPAFVMPLHDPAATVHTPAPPRATPDANSQRPANQLLPFGATALKAYAQDLSNAYYIPSSFTVFPDLAEPTSSSRAVNLWAYVCGADFIDNDFSTVYAVDAINRLVTIPTDGSGGGMYHLGYDVVGALSSSDTPLEWTGLKWDASTGTLYGVRLDSTGQTSLYTIDRRTALISLVGTLPTGIVLIDIAIDAEGHMYGLDIGNDALVAIDKTSADAQPLGSLGFNAQYAQGMDFDDASGLLYLAGFDGDSMTSGLYTVDTLSGAATLIGPLADGREFDALAIASPTPGCADPATLPWLSFDPATGTTAPDGTSNVTVTLDASTLGDGVYRANLCLHNNGVASSAVAVPVTFTVGSGVGDRIFHDGFDGGAL